MTSGWVKWDGTPRCFEAQRVVVTTPWKWNWLSDIDQRQRDVETVGGAAAWHLEAENAGKRRARIAVIAELARTPGVEFERRPALEVTES